MIDLVRNGLLVAAYGIQGELREQVKTLLSYYRLETESSRGQISRVAVPVRMWAERPDGSMIFYAGYVPKFCGLLQSQGLTWNSYTRQDRPEPLAYDLSRVDVSKFRPEQLKMLEAIVTWEGGQIISGTGTGKSWFCAQICKLYPTAKIVFSAPTIDTVGTLRDYLQKNCGEEVGQVGGGKRHSRRITASTYDSVTKISDVENCDILIVDESHRACAEAYARAFASIQSPRKRFGLTATGDGRSDKSEWMAEGLFGPIIVEIPYSDSVKSGSVVPLEIIVHANPYGPDLRVLEACRHQADKDRIALWMNRDRNALIVRDVQEMQARLGDPQTLILVDRTEHLLALQELLPDYEIALGPTDQKDIDRINKKTGTKHTLDKVASAKDRDRIRERFESGAARHVLATGVFTTGVSSNSCGLIAVASGAGASIAFRQSIGRGSRVENGKEYAVCLLWEDTFHRGYRARAHRLIAAAHKDGHRITRIPISAGVSTWTPPG